MDFEHRFLMPDGSVKHVHVIGRGSHSTRAKEAEIVGTVMDITYEKEGI